MADEHGKEAEAALDRARRLLAAPGPLDEAARREVLTALDELGKALGPAIRAQPEEVRSLSHFAEAVAHEATRPEPSRSIVESGLEGLGHAAERLEQRYPTIVEAAQRLAETLSQIGI
jgi:hypothetical protein